MLRFSEHSSLFCAWTNKLATAINNKDNLCVFESLQNCGLIREILVYGKMIKCGLSDDLAPQHKGLGSLLIKKAEELTKSHGLSKIAVISGIGVNQYYIKKHYFERTEFNYLIKNI